MDNKKIGKLISDLRRKQGLTQEQLGEKLGVGFRAVSKWETGKTLPDIGLINDLSKILGISSDELLTGELKETKETKVKNKLSPRITTTILTLIIIFITISSIYIYQYNKSYTYKLVSAEKDEYYVNGTINFNKDDISISIPQIELKDELLKNIEVINYEYKINVNDKFIFGYGFIDAVQQNEETLKVNGSSNDLNISYIGKTKNSKQEFIKNGLNIEINFLTSENQIISKELKVKLTKEEAENK